MKKVVLSMDVEDWYHLDYFNREDCDTNYSMLDGLDIYVDFLEKFSLPSSFFVLGELGEINIEKFKKLSKAGYDIGSHGWDHVRPMTLSLTEFSDDLLRCSEIMREINSGEACGYRAPCFSLDAQRLEIIKKLGFIYDASRIDFDHHPLYGSIDMSGFDSVTKKIFRQDDFFEFETTTLHLSKQTIPISGGGYLRIFPWSLMKRLISSYLQTNDIYVLYIHPFELSARPAPYLSSSIPLRNRFRFRYGRDGALEKIKRLVSLAKEKDYVFTTFKAIQNSILLGHSEQHET